MVDIFSEVYRRALVGNYQLHKFDVFMDTILRDNPNSYYTNEKIIDVIESDIDRTQININGEIITKKM